MTRSIESRFLAIVAITVFILVVPLFALFLTLSSDRAAKELQDHVEILLATNSQALAKPMWDFDHEGVEQIVATIISTNSVSKVQVRDLSGGINISMPPLPAWPKSGVESKSREIFYEGVEGRKPVGTITIYYGRFDALSSLRDAEAILIGIFVVAVLGVVLAAIFGNRLMIIQPLMKLTAAIEATRQLGSRHHVDWQSNDEIG
ncbi:MAG: diguanylate cyclase, partial [Rhizobium sp.]|nr:diguanylate cyclase [Rhizobium sp.]